MKKLLLGVLTVLLSSSTFAADPINAIIGNESLLYNTSHAVLTEQNRIQLHLKHVLKKLNSVSVQHLSKDLQDKRVQMLEYLEEYIQLSQFPQNRKYCHQRKPCFIDDRGAICAVGYLVKQSAGLAVAEYINAKFQYNYIAEMNDEVLDTWISNSGLTKQECAMIQPTYGFPTYPDDDYHELKKGDAIATGLLSGMSVSSIMINGFGSGRFQQSKGLPAVGIVVGVTQLGYGMALFPKPYTDDYGRTAINKVERNVSIMNIGLGTANLIMSTWELLSNRKPKDKRTVWNLYSTPTINNSTAYGFRIGRRIG